MRCLTFFLAGGALHFQIPHLCLAEAETFSDFWAQVTNHACKNWVSKDGKKTHSALRVVHVDFPWLRPKDRASWKMLWYVDRTGRHDELFFLVRKRPLEKYKKCFRGWGQGYGAMLQMPGCGGEKEGFEMDVSFVGAKKHSGALSMIGIALNSRLATSFVLRVTRRRTCHLACILNNT